MTIQADNTLISNREMLTELVLSPFRALGRVLVYLAETNSRTQVLQAIAAMSDEELAAKGMTRAEAISLMFRHEG